MQELYKEIGKYFFNLSLIVIGGLLIKKFAEGRITLSEVFLGLFLSVLSFIMGVIFFKRGLENERN